MIEMFGLKCCIHCYEVKKFKDFSRDSWKPLGIRNACKICDARNKSIRIKRNRDIENRCNARRRAYKLKATPKWANEKYILMFYKIAKEENQATGKKYHVDHIVPLKSKLVCGLHVEWNLQVLPEYDNLSKGNREWPDMWK